jgi:hypothetical protein
LQRIELRDFLTLRPLLRPQQIRGKNGNIEARHYPEFGAFYSTPNHQTFYPFFIRWVQC